MPDILRYVREKLDWAAGRILELLTGLSGYRPGEVRARVPDVRRAADPGPATRIPPSRDLCDRH